MIKRMTHEEQVAERNAKTLRVLIQKDFDKLDDTMQKAISSTLDEIKKDGVSKLNSTRLIENAKKQIEKYYQRKELEDRAASRAENSLLQMVNSGRTVDLSDETIEKLASAITDKLNESNK